MKMQLLIYLNILTIVHGNIPTRACNRIKIGNFWYDKEILWKDIGKPYSLNVHKTTNTIFFSYSMPETYTDLDFQLGYVHIDTGHFDTIAGIKGGCAIAIDQYTDVVYLGGSDGIYKYNLMTKIADFYMEKGQNIWSLFYKRNLFYISYPTQKLHLEIDGKFSTVKEFETFDVDNFYVTNFDDIYFANKTGFYQFDNELLVAKLLNDLIVVRQMTEDNDDNMYVSTNVGLFMNSPNDGLQRVIEFKNIYGVAFDKNNNLIFSDENSIVKLKLSKIGCGKNITSW